MRGGQKPVLKIFGDIFSDPYDENSLPRLRNAIKSSIKWLMLHFIPSLFKAIQLLLEKPAVLGGDHASDVFNEKVLGLHLNQSPQILSIEEISSNCIEIPFFSFLPAASSCYAKASAGIASYHYIRLGEGIYHSYIFQNKLYVGEKGLISHGRRSVNVICPDYIDTCHSRSPIEAAASGKKRHRLQGGQEHIPPFPLILKEL